MELLGRELSFFVQGNNYASEFYIYRDSPGCCLFMEARVYDYNELLAVDESQRRSGIATALIEKLVQYGLSKQLRAIFVDLDDDNLEAEDFYKSIEFKKAGKIIEYYYDYSDATILIKRL